MLLTHQMLSCDFELVASICRLCSSITVMILPVPP